MNRQATPLHAIVLGFVLLPFALTGCDNDDGDGNSQRRITGTCATGTYITAVNEDGTVECGAAGSGDITDVSTNGGLVGGAVSGSVALSTDPAVLQRRVSGVCPGNTFATAINADGTMACAPGGDITSIATSGPLAGGGTSGDVTVSLSNGGIDTAHLADDAVTMSKAALPVGSAAGAMPNGSFFSYPANLTPTETAASCLVTASAITYGLVTVQGFRVRPVIRNVANQQFVTSEWGYSHDFRAEGLANEPMAPNGNLSGREATATAVLNVTGASPWNVGCEVQGNNTAIRCRVSYLCS